MKKSVIIILMAVSFFLGFCTHHRVNAETTKQLDGSAFQNSPRDVEHAFFLFGLKRMAEKMKIQKARSDELKLSFDYFCAPIPNYSNLKKLTKTAQVYDLDADNWFYKKGLRSGDFIYNILHIYDNRSSHLPIETLQNGAIYDIIKPDSKVIFWIYRVYKWESKDHLIPDETILIEIQIK